MGEWEKRGEGKKGQGKMGRGEWEGEMGRGRGEEGGAWEQGRGFETQVNGGVSQMGGFGSKVFPSTSMDESNDELSMVGTPDSA